ncbi:choice-of-anchor M domain-containing protein [Oerskovia flava]|uniref:choice-of-anchor M domain-containing protein n=1 Tax=Oerskovia flava TaxID=2986422 RepID=UPI0022400A3F|nr:choice-of-anchor M domain-containing protein [Oerskovia sp. JB1-3-2]
MTPRTLRLLAPLVLAGTLAAAPATATAVHTDTDPGLDQRVGADEETVDGREVVAQGHVDIGPRFLDGTWTLQARDDRQVPPVWRSTEETVVHVVDESVLPAPESPDFAFLGVEPETPLWVVPQVQNQEVTWLGWNTQDPEVTERIDRGATLRLDGVDGPGAFFLFLQEGVTGPPNVLWNSGEAYPQDLWMEVNTHVHANWVFTEPGVYTFDVTVLADLTDGSQVEDSGVLRFAVGTETDPQTAFAAAATEEEPADESPETQDAGADDTAESQAPQAVATEPATDPADADGSQDSAVSTVVLWGGIALLVLLAAVVATVVRGRRARALAELEADQAGGGS